MERNESKVVNLPAREVEAKQPNSSSQSQSQLPTASNSWWRNDRDCLLFSETLLLHECRRFLYKRQSTSKSIWKVVVFWWKLSLLVSDLYRGRCGPDDCEDSTCNGIFYSRMGGGHNGGGLPCTPPSSFSSFFFHHNSIRLPPYIFLFFFSLSLFLASKQTIQIGSTYQIYYIYRF